jgi:thermitase
MAESRPAPTLYRRNNNRLTGPLRSSVRLSILLAMMLIAPLWLQITSSATGDRSVTPVSKTGRIFTLSQPPANSTPDPIPDEVLVRFELPLATRLLRELADSKRPFGLGALPEESALIGARLPGDQATRVAPELAAFANRFGLWAVDAIDPVAGTWRLKLGHDSDPYAAVTALSENAGVVYAELNYPIYAFSREPNDPFYSRGNQWALRKIGAPDAWDITTGSDKVTIAILDSGLAYGHSELHNKILTDLGRNFVAEPANEFAWDDNGHGTFVAGIATAETNNASGMAGVAWNAKLLPVKVLDYGYQGSIATLAMGLAYITTQSVQVANISAGGTVRSRLLEEACEKAFDKGIVLVAAAGNSGKEEFNYPAAFDTVIAVGASDEADRAALFTSYGPYLALVAPGTDILGLNWASDTDYARNFGTSAACPFVTGTVALMLAVNPNLTPWQIRNILENTTDTSPYTPAYSVTPGANPTPTAGIGPTPTPTATPIPVPLSIPASAPTSLAGAVQATTLSAGYNTHSGWGRLNTYRAVLAASNSTSYTTHYAALTGTITGLPNPMDVTISLNPGDTRYPDQNGYYQFGHLPPGDYQVLVESTKYNLKITTEFTVEGMEGESLQRDFDFTENLNQFLKHPQAVGAFRPTPAVTSDDLIHYFPETGHTISGKFKDFWENRGGLAIFGYPISQEFQENGRTVQYFERMVLEDIPEYADTRAEVQPRLLGMLTTQNRTETAFKRLAPLGSPYPISADTRYFDETGHSLKGSFRAFWEANGGMAIFGYPISEPFRMVGSDGQYRLVQYFQRCRMEYFPEQEDTSYVIQLGLLARDIARTNYLLGDNSNNYKNSPNLP